MAPCLRIEMLLLLLALGAGARAGATLPDYPLGQYQLRTYGTAEGLASVTVQQLLQDRAGFLWVGTQDGVYRYDGYRFEGFGLRQGLASTSITALFEDATGIFWAGTRAGLSRWNGRSFESVASTRGLPPGIVMALADHAGGLCVALTAGPWCAASNGRFELAPGWSGGEATALSGTRGELWIAQWQGAAILWRWRAGNWQRFDAPAGLGGERVDAIVGDRRGRIFARTARSLWLLPSGGERFVAVETPRPLTATRGTLQLGRHDELWVPTDRGLLELDGERWTVGLRGQMIPSRAVLEDSEGTLWFGSTGLNRVLGRGVFHTYAQPQGLPGNIAWSFLRDRAGQLWVGTDEGLARQQGARFVAISGTELYTVRSIVEATDGSFYLAGIPANDILHFDPASGQLERTELAPDSPAKRIFRLLLDAQGMLWASTEGAGLLRADTHATPLTFERVELPGGTPDEYISDLHLDQDGRLWAAGQCGLALLENGKWRRFGSANGLRSDFIAYARSTAKGELLIVYFEPRGFTRARYADGKFEVLEHYDSESHGITDKIYLIGEDAKGRIWVGGGRGVDLLSAAGVEHFGLAEGLLGEDTAGMAFRAEDDGDVWIGAVGGLVRFDSRLHASLPPRVPPATALLSVTLGKHAASPYGPKVEVPPKDASFVARFAGVGYLGEGSLRYRMRLNGLEDDYTISEQREARYVALPPGPYRFEVAAQLGPQGPFGPPAFFQFAVQPAWWQSFWFRTLLALVVGSGIAMLMRWRLTSLHRQNLQLEARVASRTGELSEANQALLDANTQLQEQVATRVAAEVAVQQRNAELEALNDKLAGTQNQLLQSEKMASVGQLAAGVAHEINNPVGYVRSNLGTLKQYLQDIFTLLRAYEPVEKALPADHPELRKMLAIKASIDFDYVVADTTSLLQESREGLERVEKIVKDLKDFSHLDEPEWQLADIHRVLESTLNVVSHELKYKVELVKEYGELPLIRCLPFQLNQVFLNLLINAVQAIDAHGRITIRTGRDLGEVWVQVTDTGKGIDPAVVKRIFEPFFTTKPVGLGTGLGLSVSWSIVQTHGGRIDVASEVGKGTSFTVHLPIGAV